MKTQVTALEQLRKHRVVVLSEVSEGDLNDLYNALCQGGKWFCGATGNRKLAREMFVEPRALEAVVAACWNEKARRACKARNDPDGEKCYRYALACSAAQSQGLVYLPSNYLENP